MKILLKGLAAILLVPLALLFAGIATAVAQTQPNIVVIMTDDQDDNNSVRTSTMERVLYRLGERGVRFTNSFANFPVCCPSRSSFLTGKSAHNHGVLGNQPASGGGYAAFYPQEGETLGVWLQRAGYRTALMGKFLNGYDLHETVVPDTHVPPGWDKWHGLLHNHYDHPTFNENGVPRRIEQYQTDILRDKATAFIDAQAGTTQPFFLLVTPFAPHSQGVDPAVPAARHAGRFADIQLLGHGGINEVDVSDKPAFVQAVPPMDAQSLEETRLLLQGARESLLAVDEMIEEIFLALGRTDKLLNTIVIFTADNGYLFGEHRLIGKGVVYDESIRVPLFVRGPGMPKNVEREQLVSNLDVVATILDYAGAVAPFPLDGRSLRPLLQATPGAWRTALLVQGMKTANHRYFAVRTQSAIYAEHTSTVYGAEVEFYDLAIDPRQVANRAAAPSYAAKVAEHAAILATLKTCAGATCWYDTPLTAQAVSGGQRSRPSAVYRGPLKRVLRRDFDRQERMDE